MTRPLALALCLLPGLALGHGDVAPQPVNTDALPDIGEEWAEQNPYRADVAGAEVWAKAVEIGASGYNQNCARCHGLEVVSGGLAPDLRYLEANIDGDEWYVERFVHGYTQNGITKMPAFGELLGQKAGWAIRTYIETRPDDGALDDYADELKGIRDDLKTQTDAAKVAAHQARLAEIAGEVATASGAPIADSAASRAAAVLAAGKPAVDAAEILTIGLSAAE